jgi:hypothetical protein
VNSRTKGKRGELEWAAYARDRFKLVGARRSQQYKGTADSEDVLTFPGTHCEVKRVQNLNIEKALQQAKADASYAALRGAAPKIPYVAHRKNNGDWMVTGYAEDLIAFCQRVLASQEQQP